jgi:cytochrome oxidase Cu insertion factor (SCO1/SenC/PrrC family)
MRKPRQILRGILFATTACLLLAGSAQALQVGERAPGFTLAAPDGKPVKLADLLGKGPVVIFTFIQAFNGP